MPIQETKPAAPIDNRFDFLRLLFASLVFLFHAIVLTNFAANSRFETLLGGFAEISIQGFFIISGALVYGSLLNSDGLGDYFGKRARRLLPAYVVIILIPALISLAITRQWVDVSHYVVANLSFLNFIKPDLPGLFEGLRFPVVNGALWTLKIEVMFYMALPVIGWLMVKARSRKWALLGAIYVFAEIWRGYIANLDIGYAEEIARQLPGQMSFFVGGITLWILRDKARQYAGTLGLIGAALLALSYGPYLEPIRALGLVGLVACVAYLPGIKLNAARFGDISYGVYITHFPIVNAALALGLFTKSYWIGFGVCVFAVFLSSFALWRFVEKPFLRRSSHYRRAERTD